MKSAKKDKKFEEDIKRLGTVLASIRDGVIVANTEGKVLAANPASELFTGMLAGDILGKNLKDILKFSCAKTDPAWFLPEALGGWRAVALPADCSLLRGHADPLPVMATTTPLYTADDKYAGIVVTLRDLTEEAAAKQQQYQFLSMVAHQLRQPFSLLRMGLENILSKKNKEEQFTSPQVELLNDLYKVVIQNMDTINELLNLSRLERGMVEFKIEDFDVMQVVREIAEEFKGLAVGKNVELRIPPAGGAPFIIRADRARSRDIFQNLITNAILYNRPRGEVSVEAEYVSREKLANAAFKKEDIAEISGDKFVVVTVADTGMGIPVDEQGKIFTNFFRASNVVKKGLRGTGLGLAIVKSMIEKLGGRITFRSKVDEGTAFYLVFPAGSDGTNSSPAK